jgi:hypothetical protein
MDLASQENCHAEILSILSLNCRKYTIRTALKKQGYV